MADPEKEALVSGPHQVAPAAEVPSVAPAKPSQSKLPAPSSKRLESAPSLDELRHAAEKEIETAQKEAAARADDPVVRESVRDVVAKPSSAHLEAAKPASASGFPAAAKSSAKMVAAPSAKMPAEPLDARPLAAYELLARSARLPDVIALATRIIGDAAKTRTTMWTFASKVSTAAGEMKLSREDADTRFGNALDVLGTGGAGEAERALAAALWAHAVAEAPRKHAEDEDRLAGDILWLATHTAFDATPLLDRALGDEAADLWTAIADRVRRIERSNGGALGRGEAIIGCAALAASGSAKAKSLCESLAREVKDPVLLRVLATGDHATPEEVRLEGEWLPAPRGPVMTAILAFTGILFAVWAVRIVAKLALAYRRPTEISLSEAGVRVKTRIEMLGRVLKEREHVILRAGLVRVVREVRFPRAAFYAGLFTLALGSWIGVRAFVDGVRSASPSLLLVGLIIIAVGIGLDFVLGTVLPGMRGKVRMAFVPRNGATVCIGDLDAKRADDALARSLNRR